MGLGAFLLGYELGKSSQQERDRRRRRSAANMILAGTIEATIEMWRGTVKTGRTIYRHLS